MENNNVQGGGKIDVSQLVNIGRRNWKLFAISLFTCVLLAGVYLYRKHSIYSVHAKVLVSYDDGAGSMGSTLMQSLSLGGVGGSSVDDEVLVMNAHSIRAQAIKELKLNRSYSSNKNFIKKNYYYNDSPVEISVDDAVLDTLGVGLKFTIDVNENADEIEVKVKKGRFTTVAEVEATSLPVAVVTPYGKFEIDTTSYFVKDENITVYANVCGNSILSESYAQDISVFKTEKKANGISLYIEDINTDRGKDILNKIIELYNRRGQDEKNEMAVRTAEFIDERLKALHLDLSSSEAKIQGYKQQNKIVDVAAEATYLFTMANELDNKLKEAETEYEILEMTRDFVADPKNRYALIPFYSDNGAGSNLIAKHNELALQRLQLMENAKANNVAIKTTNAKLDALLGNIVSTLDKSYESASVRLAELRKQTNKSQSKLGNLPEKEREFIGLQREYSIRNTLYTFLLQKREENQLVLAASTPKGKIIDSAFAYDEPIAPKKLVILFIAFVMGILLPMVWLYLKSMFTNKFDSQEALARITPLPIAGEICHSRSAASSPLIVDNNSKRPVVELFRLLRSNLQFMLPATAGCKVVLVTSSCSGEGKTFVSMNLAESLALTGKRVVLVGVDIRIPRLAENLNISPAPGVTNYLSGAVDTIGELVQRVKDLDVIVAGPVPPNPSELLISDRFNEFIETLKSQYDYIILDTAPIGLVSDTFNISKYSDTVLYVTRVNYTRKQFIKYLNGVVEKGQLKNIALVVNDTDIKQSNGYGYGYGAKEDED